MSLRAASSRSLGLHGRARAGTVLSRPSSAGTSASCWQSFARGHGHAPPLARARSRVQPQQCTWRIVAERVDEIGEDSPAQIERGFRDAALLAHPTAVGSQRPGLLERTHAGGRQHAFSPEPGDIQLRCAGGARAVLPPRYTRAEAANAPSISSTPKPASRAHSAHRLRSRMIRRW